MDEAASSTDADRRAAELAGELATSRRALAQAATELERLSPVGVRLLARIAPQLAGTPVVGIAGPPGAGKSTLVNALIVAARARGSRLAVIAVDPASPLSGGAILGDRVRMSAAIGDDGVFVRSLSSSGHMGGLSPAAVRMIDAFDAARFDLIVLETVGTGQAEVDIAEVADVRVVVSAPGLGDAIQAIKSGLLEIADILVVNKADRPDAEHAYQQLAGALSLRPAGRSGVSLLKTSATGPSGIDGLLDAISLAAGRAAAIPLAERRRRRARYLMARAAADLVARRIKALEGTRIDSLADELLMGAISPHEAARRLLG